MILTLEVSASQGAKLGARRQVFSEQGGTIGRLNENSLVLPHGKVSGRHAVISYRNAVFYIEDTSRNGVSINSMENRLAPSRPYALKSGDRIFIDPYEIYVSLAEEPREVGQRPLVEEPNPFHEEDDPFAGRRAQYPESSPVPPAAEGMGGEELDPLKLLDPSPKPAPMRKPPSARDLAHGSLLDQHYQPPTVLPASGPPRPDPPMIPQGYDPMAPDDSASFPAPSPPPIRPAPPRFHDVTPPSPPPIPRAQQPSPGPVNPLPVPDAAIAPVGHDAGAPDMANLLAGAGLDGAPVTPELMRNFGQILRIVVSGVMDVLQARQQIKDEFRMHMTHFRPADNNPLKFSANVEDALHNLLVKRNPAYLPPVEAFEDAFDDLRNHQIAILAGMRVAFESMLAEFDPEHLQQQFDRQLSKGSLLSVPAKLRYWDLYRDKCRDMVKDPEASFRELFGEQFAKAYEDQLKRLKAESPRGPGKSRR